MTDPWKAKMLAKLADGSLLRDLESQRSPEEIVGEWLAGDDAPGNARFPASNVCSAVPPTPGTDGSQNGSQPYRSLARHFGAVRGRAGIYKNARVAEDAFSALYPAQPDLASAALAGWLEVGA